MTPRLQMHYCERLNKASTVMSPPLQLVLLAYPAAFVQVFPYHNASSYAQTNFNAF